MEFQLLENDLKNATINETEAGAVASAFTLSVAGGKMFVVFQLYLHSSAACTVTVKSGATEIGRLVYSAAGLQDVKNAGAPVYRARAGGDDFILGVSAATTLSGHVAYVKRETRQEIP